MHSWIRSGRACALSGLIACGILIAAAQPAAAQPVEHTHSHEVFTIPDAEVCDLPVILTIDVVNTEQIRIGRNGFPLFKNTGAGTATFTNPETGKSVVVRFTGASKDLSVTDNGDGTITVRTAVTGLPEQVKLSDGSVAIRDAGRVIFATVLDYNGTPTNADDDIFISETVESISGPHPDLESDVDLFCATVLPALT
jgi:hypothetical protein